MTDHEQKMRDFARALIRLSWDGAPDGGDIQDLAEKHGLIVGVIYDPDKHGDDVDAVPGEDTIYVFSDWMKEDDDGPPQTP